MKSRRFEFPDSTGDFGDCFRFSDGNWIYNLRLDAFVFTSGSTYLVEVELSNWTLMPSNPLFQTK